MNLPSGLDQLGTFGLLIALAGAVMRWLAARIEQLHAEAREDRQRYMAQLEANTRALTSLQDEIAQVMQILGRNIKSAAKKETT